MAEIKHVYVTYNDIHNIIRNACPKIAADFNPDLMIAIGTSNKSSSLSFALREGPPPQVAG